MPTVGILGGGISGLSAAYYLRKKIGSTLKLVLFEKSDRVGGWIKSHQRSGEVYYESGPRSFRPVGLSALSCLDLVEEIGLDKTVLYVPSFSPVVKNRFILKKGHLERLPTEIGAVFLATPPFEKALFWALMKDLMVPRKRQLDESIHSFVQRRFGLHLADYGIDPLVRGLCAGDARQISVKLTMRSLHEYEQRYGSVVLGMLIRRLFNIKLASDTALEIPGHETIGFSAISTTCVKENWALWGLENGTESLVHKLEEILNQQNVDILKNCDITKVDFKQGRISYNKDELHCDQIISAIPAWELCSLLRKSEQYPDLAETLSSIQGIDVIVTNVMYRNPDVHKEEAFGFLVPSGEVKNTSGIEGLLGVVFDSCTFDQGGATVLTVMSWPTKDTVDEASIRKTVLKYLRITMSITAEPDEVFISRSNSCIPQYLVGHYEKVEAARALIKGQGLPLVLAGASYDGVSVNDCIYSGRRTAEYLPIQTEDGEQLLLQ